MIFFVVLLLAASEAHGAVCPYQPGKTCHEVLRAMVYYDAKVYTVDPDDSNWQNLNPYNSIVVEDGVITYIGSKTGAFNKVAGITPQSQVKYLDMWNSPVLPGFIDTHQHPLEAGNTVGGTCFLPRNRNLDSSNYRNKLASCWQNKPAASDWVVGFGHSISRVISYVTNPNKPDPKTLLDHIPHPTAILEETSHSVWVNQLALDALGFTSSTPDPEGGKILKNSAGEPNGILFENAGNIALSEALDVVDFPGIFPIAKAGLLDSLDLMARNGITSLVDARNYWAQNYTAVWEELENDGDLTVRATLALWAYAELTDSSQITEMINRYRFNENDLLNINQVKVYMDGIIEGTSAALQAPYDANYNFYPSNKGINYFTTSRLETLLNGLQGTGFDFIIHAIGDRGTHEALDAFNNTLTSDTRHRLTHLELVDAADKPRLAQLGVIADAQFAADWVIPGTPDNNVFDGLIGSARKAELFPLSSLVSAGAKTTLSSDYDVASVNPLLGIHHAVNDINVNERISVKEAWEMYTINAAYTMRLENVTGSLKVGKKADLITLDFDPFVSWNKNQIRFLQNLQTILGGKEIFRANNF